MSHSVHGNRSLLHGRHAIIGVAAASTQGTLDVAQVFLRNHPVIGGSEVNLGGSFAANVQAGRATDTNRTV